MFVNEQDLLLAVFRGNHACRRVGSNGETEELPHFCPALKRIDRGIATFAANQHQVAGDNRPALIAQSIAEIRLRYDHLLQWRARQGSHRLEQKTLLAV